MAHDPEHEKTAQTNKSGLGLQTPLPLAERRRLVQPAKSPDNSGQVFTDWAMI